MAVDAPAQLVSEECRLMRSVIGGILSDESFVLSTEGNKICLNMAEKLARCFSAQPSERQVVDFASWLVGRLNGVIVEAQKRGKPNELNKERLWRNFQKMTCSEDFTLKWCSFLELLQLNNEPLFYQILTDELFGQLLKKRLTQAGADQDDEDHEECDELTFEEENAIRYIGGYVVRKLREQPNCAKFKSLLNELVCEDDQHNDPSDCQNENDPSAMWTKTIDRGGLVKITNEAYKILQAIECCLRRYMNVKKIPQMDEEYKRYVMKMVTNDDVLFHWCTAGFGSDEENEECLYHIVNKWITIRGFSFASSLMEMYKQERYRKSKSLRTRLFCEK